MFAVLVAWLPSLVIGGFLVWYAFKAFCAIGSYVDKKLAGQH